MLRRLRRDDLEALSILHAEPGFWRCPLGRGQTRAETEAFLERVIDSYRRLGFGLQAVIERRSGTLIGWAGLSVPTFLPEILPAVEVGWRFGSACWGNGYATEAGAAAVRLAFEVFDFDRVFSIFQPENERSGRVMARLAFELERVTVHSARDLEVHVTVLTRDRWEQRCAAGDWPTVDRSPIGPRPGEG